MAGSGTVRALLASDLGRAFVPGSHRLTELVDKLVCIPLLYVDLLGMKSRYAAAQVRGARKGYRKLSKLVAEALANLPDGTQVDGGVQSDAVALQFTSAEHAVRVGCAMFTSAFESGASNGRVWLRGVILEHGWPGAPLQKERPLPGAPEGIFERHFTQSVLNAVNLEQAGFKGQRLLIERSLVTRSLTTSLAIATPTRTLRPISRLRDSHYPSPICDNLADVLWMVPDDISKWPGRQIRMLDMLRWANRADPAEAEQASATHLVFAQVDAILNAPPIAARRFPPIRRQLEREARARAD